MAEETILVTGASGAIGHELIPKLFPTKKSIICLGIENLDASLNNYVSESIKGNILDKNLLENVFLKHKVNIIFHLLGILPPRSEVEPEKAHEVNVGGTAALLEEINKVTQKEKRVIKFIFPSTIAIYGLPDLETKAKSGKLKETEFNTPITMYGINKLYCEMLGEYYSTNYQLLTPDKQRYIDFRCVRFPGIISALTLPSGGTSDYAPEMIHSAAKGEGYESFVRPDTQIPFMVMPDAVKALLQLTEAFKEKLNSMVYNVSGFSATAQQISDIVNKVFPDSAISYNPDPNRQKIVDSWPADVDDTKAKSDWNWQADYDMEKAFKDYLIPEISNKYKK